jgi:hypothetical protein
VVERTFGWLVRYRRLVRDYERSPEQHAAMVWWATVFLMVRRLDRLRRGQGPEQRWGRARPAPPPRSAGTGPQGVGPRGRWESVLAQMGTDPSRAWHARDLAHLLGIANIDSLQAQMGRWARQGLIHKVARATYVLHPQGWST